MSPQWIPQNIQKRLLLYVLQQLSLFSEIDLPNLEEVSLKNVVLKDVSIDPEKVGKLPGCHLRDGQVGILELMGGVMGGLNIEARDVELVIALDAEIDNYAKSSLHFLLVQSTADLANTIILEEGSGDNGGKSNFLTTSETSSHISSEANSETNSENGSEVSHSGSNTNESLRNSESSENNDNNSESSTDCPSKTKSSALSGVMAKAVEMALLRLKIAVSNLKIKILSDVTDLHLTVEEVVFDNANGIRRILVKGVNLRTLNSDINGGQKDESEEENQEIAGNHSDNGVSDNDNNDNGYSDNDNHDDNDNETSEGSDDDTDDGYGEESLMNSMMFTHEEASSIYMSATSQSFKPQETTSELNDNKVDTKPIHLFPLVLHLDALEMEFEGLSSIHNLQVNVGDLKVAWVPLSPSVISILNGMVKALKTKSYQARRKQMTQKKSHRRDEVQEGPVESDDPFFSRLHVDSIVVGLTSALESSGEFASKKNNFEIGITNVTVKRKSSLLIYGGVERFALTRTDNGEKSDVLCFENDPMGSTRSTSSRTSLSGNMEKKPPTSSSKVDIRFEIFKNSESGLTEITGLLSKPTTINIDAKAFGILTDFGYSISTISSILTTLSSVKSTVGIPKASRTSSTLFILETSHITLNLALASMTLKSIIFPISFNSENFYLAIQKIILNLQLEGKELTILTISDISTKKGEEFRQYVSRNGSYNSTHFLPRPVTMTSQGTIRLEKIASELDFRSLRRLLKDIGRFYSQVVDEESLYGITEIKQKHGRRPLGSQTFNNTVTKSRALVKDTTVHITDIKPEFGGMRLKIENISLYLSRDDIVGTMEYFEIRREKKEGSKVDATNSKSVSPSTSTSSPTPTLNSSASSILQARSLSAPASTVIPASEAFILPFHGRSQIPLVYLRLKSSEKANLVDVTVRGFLIEYYTKWLRLLEDTGFPYDEVNELHEMEKTIRPKPGKRLDVRFTLYDCSLGLNPGRLDTKGLLVVNRGNSDVTFGIDQFYVKSTLREISLLLIDDVKNLKFPLLENEINRRETPYVSPFKYFLAAGYILVGSINCTHIGVTLNTDLENIKARNKRVGVNDSLALLDIKVNSEEHHIDLCADSFHTFMQLVADLKLPLDFSNEDRTRVEPDNAINLLEFAEDNNDERENTEGKENNKSNENSNSGLKNGNNSKAEPNNLSDFSRLGTFSKRPGDNLLPIVEEYVQEGLASSDTASMGLGSESSNDADLHSTLVFEEEHFTNTSNAKGLAEHPVHMNINLFKTQLYLYDGYDWKTTRKAIKAAVKKIESDALRDIKRKENKKREGAEKDQEEERDNNFNSTHVKFAETSGSYFSRSNRHDDESEDAASDNNDMEWSGSEPSLHGETLFQSIHVTLPKLSDPSSLTRNINSDIQSEGRTRDKTGVQSHTRVSSRGDSVVDSGTDSHANTSVTTSNYRNLRLRRSKSHKVLVDLKNVEVNVEVVTSRDPRKDVTPADLKYEFLNTLQCQVENINVYDNVPDSTWNKFLGYMSILGEREVGTSMVSISVANVRPDPSLVASEAVIKVDVLPLRVHADQDTVDFLVRFFEFRDARFVLPPDEILFIEKFIMNPIKLKLDYKPKKIDYAGIRSGKAAEFMNFFILDGSDLTLQKVKVHGILGIPRLVEALKNVWTPDIQRTQLAGILSGLSPLRSIVNIGGGMRDLVAIPIKEYKKDGRLMRSLKKGASVFAKTTGYEVLNLGAKLASGAQVVLEQGEEMLGGEGAATRMPRGEQRQNHHPDGSGKPRPRYYRENREGRGHNRGNASGSGSGSSSPKSHSHLRRCESSKKSSGASPQLQAPSYLLDESIVHLRDPYGSKKFYSSIDMDKDDMESQYMGQSMLLLDPKNSQILGIADTTADGVSGSDSDGGQEEDLLDQKLISLYSNQPESVQEGFKLAFKSMGRNLTSTKKKIFDLRQQLSESENIQESLYSVMKSSPVILIRPIIGTTEALSKTLMGFSNEIDPKHIIEAKDKYRWDKSGQQDEN